MALWDNNQASQYLSSDQHSKFLLQEGLYVLPVAEEPPTTTAELKNWSPVALIRAHAPYRFKQVTFNEVKSNNPPVIPSPTSSGAFIFLSGSIDFATPMPNLSGGSYDWGVSGSYIYIEDCVSKIADGFVLTNQPFASNIQQSNKASYNPTSSGQGAIDEAGPDAKIGYSQGKNISETANWLYNTPSYFPSELLNSQLVNGYTHIPTTTTPPLDIFSSIVDGSLFTQVANQVTDLFGDV